MPHAARTILVVDDDEDVLLLASNLLGDLGYAVVQATNGSDGLRILAERPDIDLLFTDILMPGGINGFELADRALAKRPDLRVLYTSGFVGDPECEKRMHNSRFLPKPWRHQSLKDELERAFD